MYTGEKEKAREREIWSHPVFPRVKHAALYVFDDGSMERSRGRSLSFTELGAKSSMTSVDGKLKDGDDRRAHRCLWGLSRSSSFENVGDVLESRGYDVDRGTSQWQTTLVIGMADTQIS